MVTKNPFGAPFIGSLLGHVSSAFGIGSISCSPTPLIWVEAFFVNTPRLIWSLFKPDPLDFDFETHGGRRRKRRRLRFSAFGELAPTYEVPRGFGTALFHLGALAQRIGWWFVIVDSASELAVNWMTTAYQYQGCIPQVLGPCQLNTDAGWVLVPGEDGDVFWDVAYDPNGWDTVNGIYVPAGIEVSVTASITANHYPPSSGPTGQVSWYVYDAVSGQHVLEAPYIGGGSKSIGDRYSGTKMYPAHGSPRNLRVRTRCTGGYAELRGSQFMVQPTILGRDNPLLFDPL